MRSIQKFAAINILAVIIGAGIPAMAAQEDYHAHGRGGMEYQAAGHRGDRDWHGNGNRDFRNDRRGDRDRRDYDRRDYDRRGYGYGYRDDRGYNYGYVPGPVYETAPVYVGPSYEDGYYYDRSCNRWIRRGHRR